jgi:large subunit ribosomal protein L24
MKKKFASSWKNSQKKRKQRKYRFNAPLHTKQKLVGVQLSKDLKKKYNQRTVALIKGDKIKVMIGQSKKHEGKVERVELKKSRIFVSGVDMTKKDGSKKLLALHPSNLMVVELNLDVKSRQKLKVKK